MRVTSADVIIVGAGPTGLMLAAELRLAGVRPVLLERSPQLRTVPKANGFSGQILQVAGYRGLSARFEAVGTAAVAATIPFGELHVDLSRLADPPLRAMHLPQPKLEALLDEWATELGAEVRRGHEVTGVDQDDNGVVATVRGPDGEYRLTASYVVACDGARSRVRELAGIDFPGTTYPEVMRLGQVSVPDSVTQLDTGDLELAGHGRIPTGFTRTEHGVFAVGPLSPAGTLMIQTTENAATETDDNDPMTLAELQDSIRRVLGVELPMFDPIRLSRYQFQARQAERYRAGRILVAGDAAHAFPATGVGINAGMLDAVNLGWKLAATLRGWAPDGLLDSYHEERHFAGRRTMMHTQAQVALRRGDDPAADALRAFFQELLTDEPARHRVGALIAGTELRYPLANPNGHPLTGTVVPDLPLRTENGDGTIGELLHTARPVLLVLADRADLRETAAAWADRVDIRTATTADRPADALLIRPDAHIAWAATIGEPLDTAAPALRGALATWFGAPAAVPASSVSD